jgi:RNA polymerase sigma factor (sigma-70 family)
MQASLDNIREELIPTRQSLLSRLKDWDDQDGWKTFFDTYWKLIYGTAIKAGLRDAEAQDVVQETIVSVLKSIPNFNYDPSRGSFKSWLLTLTKWRIKDQLRRRQRIEGKPDDRNHPSTEPIVIDDLPDPVSLNVDAEWDRDWESNLVASAIARVKRRVDLKLYQIFDLYAIKGWPASKVAQTLGTSVPKVYLSKHRVSRLVRVELERLRKNPI